ncbi:MAG: dihydroxy-acid dehydratase, partial [Candidatus Nanopelagicales bacterium]
AYAHLAGRRIVEMVHENLTISKIITKASIKNAIMANAALGGSTNAIVHLLALAGRLGIDLKLEEFDEYASPIPLLVNLMPSGKYLMEDFYYAGGVPVVLKELSDFLDLSVTTVSGKTMGEDIANAQCYNREVIATVQNPVQEAGNSTVVLKGSLAPRGAVLKVSAASKELLQHRGQALVFDNNEEYVAASEDPNLPVTKDTVLVVRNSGPKGYPGFPEVGNMPLPTKLLKEGVTDMVRISDARMSGTGFGTCVLHVSPEAAAGGPLGIVQTGDWIVLDVKNRKLDIEISEEELQKRLSEYTPKPAQVARGWAKIYVDHVNGADQGVDLDFLIGSSGSDVPRHSH